jgi:hypothetical protein
VNHTNPAYDGHKRRIAQMTRRIGLLVAVALLAALPAAQASITMIGDPQPGGSVIVTFGATPNVGFDRIEVLSGAGHLYAGLDYGPDYSTPAAEFESPDFRNLGTWTNFPTTDPSSHGVATGPLVDHAHSLVFDLYMVGTNPRQPFAFDLYAFDSTRGNVLDFSAHVNYNGYWSTITEPAPSLYAVSGGSVPEPGAFVIWSLLGGLGVTVGWRRRA